MQWNYLWLTTMTGIRASAQKKWDFEGIRYAFGLLFYDCVKQNRLFCKQLHEITNPQAILARNNKSPGKTPYNDVIPG